MRHQIRPGDVVALWGKTDFVLMLNCDLAGAQAAMKRIRRWVLGRYTLAAGASGDAVRLKVNGDFGIVEWSAGKSAEQIVERAQANKDEPATAKVCGEQSRPSALR